MSKTVLLMNHTSTEYSKAYMFFIMAIIIKFKKNQVSIFSSVQRHQQVKQADGDPKHVIHPRTFIP